MKRGEVWSVRLPPSTGREQAGERPAVIVQDEAYGQGSPLVLVVPLTSSLAALRFPGSARLEASPTNGLNLTSVAMVFQFRAVDRTRFVRRLGVLDDADLDRLLGELDALTGRSLPPPL